MVKRHLNDPFELYSDEFVSLANPIENFNAFGHCYEGSSKICQDVE
jgi:hypothetical protein